MSLVWCAQVVIQLTNNNLTLPYTVVGAGPVPTIGSWATKAEATTAAQAAMATLKNQFSSALGNLLPQLFLTINLNGDSLPVVIRVQYVEMLTPIVFQADLGF